jgi:glyoxylase-like metal-dependent hydrolase (beta-lactamase superfamily II)
VHFARRRRAGLAHIDDARYDERVATAAIEPARQLADGVWVLPLRTPTLPPATATNTVVVAGDRVAVIEPATPHADEQARLHDHLSQLHAEGKEVAGIFITHHHSDHVGHAEALRRRVGAPIYAHAGTADRVGFSVDVHLSDGERVDLGGTSLLALHTPGHAPGHLCFFDTRSRVLHGGDLVAGEGTILIDPRDDGDLAVYLESLRAMAERIRSEWPRCRLVPAHGPVQDDPVALLEHYVRHRLGRETKLLASFSGGEELDDDELLRRTYDDVPASVLPLARWSLEAHLAKLVAEGSVSRQDGKTRRTRA